MTLALISMLFITAAKADPSLPWQEISGFKCQKEMESLIQERNWNNLKYRSSIPDHSHQYFYRSLSPQIGKGLEIQISTKEPPAILNIHDQKISKYKFSENCKWQISEEKMPWHLEKFFTNLEGHFSDYQLKKILDSNKAALIYSWSPKYSYSVYDLPKIAKIAKKLNFDFYPVVDPRVDASEIKDSLKRIENEILPIRQIASHLPIAKNVSMELYFRGGFNHFPITYIISNKKINPRFIIGVMKDEGYTKMIKDLAAELK